MKETNVFVPELRNTRSTLAISCLARAMEAEGKVAIVRCVWRAGQANVALGVLTPCLGSDDSVVSLQITLNFLFSFFAHSIHWTLCSNAHPRSSAA